MKNSNIDTSRTDPSVALGTAGLKSFKLDPTVFKAYDVRGVYPGQVNEDLYYK